MKIIIHRGSNQIGGNCVEVATNSTRIILDVGKPLPGLDEEPQQTRSPVTDPIIEAVFAKKPPIAAVLLSHAHADHTGLIPLVPTDVPIYLSEGTSKMMLAGSLYAGQARLDKERQRILKPQAPERIGNVIVTAYPVDHSAFDSQAFLIEADGRRVLYSGDLRLHGRKPGMAKALIADVAGKVDVLLMEGTHLSSGRDKGPTEKQLEQIILADIESAPGLVLACFSPMHVDRLVTIYKAALRAKRNLVLDHYGAYVLSLASTMARVPKPEREAGMRVFLPQRRRVIPKVERRFACNFITIDNVLADSRRYVMLFRSSMIDTDFEGRLPERVRCLYSYWSGYLKKPEEQRMQAKVREAEGDFLVRHTSGHVFAEDIVGLVRKINPRQLIPIHTAQPMELRKHFSSTRLLQDNECFLLQAIAPEWTKRERI